MVRGCAAYIRICWQNSECIISFWKLIENMESSAPGLLAMVVLQKGRL